MIVQVKVLKVRRLPRTGVGNSRFEFETDLGLFTTPANSMLNHWIAPEKRFIGNRYLFKVEDRTVTAITEIEE